MEQDNDNVLIGKYLDESSYPRDEKHINIDGVINIDFIRPGKVLHEVKKSRKIEDANIWQVKYYLYYLKNKGINDIKGRIDYPLLRQTVDVVLEKDDETELDKFCEEIRYVDSLSVPPDEKRKGICRACSYFDLCYI